MDFWTQVSSKRIDSYPDNKLHKIRVCRKYIELNKYKKISYVIIILKILIFFTHISHITIATLMYIVI